MEYHAPRRPVVAAFALAAGLTALSVHAQCPQWLPGSGVPGIYGTVNAAVEWDADGPGGNDPVLVVGGTFTLADSTFVSNIAVWNGASWSALGSGFNDTVNALAVYNGDLIAGGSFSASGATTLGRIARWNGSSWVRLNSGTDVDLGGSPSAPIVFALVSTPTGDLIAGGSFTIAGTNTTGSITVNRIARWNGTQWGEINPSATGVGASNNVNALALASNGDLLVGGAFLTIGDTAASRIARCTWNGADWAPAAVMGTALNSTVNAIAVDGNDIVAVGNFTNVGTRVAKWVSASNNWTALSPGFDQGPKAVAVLPNHDIVAGGSYNQIQGSQLSRSLARWNGSAWQTMWPADAETFAGDLGRSVQALLVRADGSLVVGGSFRSAGAGVAVNGVASWSGGVWSDISDIAASTNSSVTAMTTLDSGDVVVGGALQSIQGVPVHGVARWNGSAWSTIGSGLYSADQPTPLPNDKGPITSIAQLSGGDIVVGGTDLTVAPGGTRAVIARWNGSAWSLFSPNIEPRQTLPAPFPPTGVVTSLFPMPNNGLFVGANPVYFPGSGVKRYVLQWDGTQWIDTGAFTNNMARTLVVLPDNGGPDSGNLVVAGSTVIDTNANASRIGQWDRTSVVAPDNTPAWTGLGKGANSEINALLLLPGGDLVAVGQFTAVGNAAAGDTPANGIARWNRATSTWTTYANGLNGIVNAIVRLPNGDLVVGGEFTAAGNAAAGDTPANHIARWKSDTLEWTNLGDGVNDTVYSLAVAGGGELLVGGEFTTAGGEVSAYIARWGCPVVVCAADFNGVNGVTVQDIFDFLTAWLAGSPSADFNHVNGVTVQDIFDFLTAWLAGC